jgi:hypothetical protein
LPAPCLTVSWPLRMVPRRWARRATLLPWVTVTIVRPLCCHSFSSSPMISSRVSSSKLPVVAARAGSAAGGGARTAAEPAAAAEPRRRRTAGHRRRGGAGGAPEGGAEIPGEVVDELGAGEAEGHADDAADNADGDGLAHHLADDRRDFQPSAFSVPNSRMRRRGPWEHIGRLWTNGDPFLAVDAALRSTWRGFSNDDYDLVVTLSPEEDTSVPVGAGRGILVGADGVVGDDSWMEVFLRPRRPGSAARTRERPGPG